MNIYDAANWRLAKLKGWSDIEQNDDMIMGIAPGDNVYAMIPPWCQDSRLAGELVLDYRLDLTWYSESIDIFSQDYSDNQDTWPDLYMEINFRDHNSAAQAYRYAIVRVSIAQVMYDTGEKP